MPQAIINLDDEEDKIVNHFSKEWNLSKHETIKKIIRQKEVKNVGKKEV